MTTVDERTRLLDSYDSRSAIGSGQLPEPPSIAHPEDGCEPSNSSSLSGTVWHVVPVLLFGEFLANADTSLVVAASQKIASEFDALSDASWLITSYLLASCAIQPLYGRLSDIFGRKANVLVSYIFFALGCLLCAVGPTLWLVVLGRAISGIGAAGITALISVVIADIVPVRQVATWRSYVNVVAVAARALGAPLGGLLIDLMGWRMTFLVQVPLTVLATIFVSWKLPSRISKEQEAAQLTWKEKVQRIDVLGAFTLVASIISLLLVLDFAAKEAPWWQIATAAGVCLKLLGIFYYIERHWAREPVLSIDLMFKRDVATTYLISGTQQAAQFSMFYSVPMYFQILAHASIGSTGLDVMPAVVGNAMGGIFAGILISRTGRYKKLTVAGTMIALVGYILILVQWAGSINRAEVLYLLPAGFGTGIILSTIFVHLTASLEQEDMAVAGTMLFCIQNMGLLIGIQVMTTVLHARLRTALDTGLWAIEGKNRIVEDAVSDINLIWSMPEDIRRIVTTAYVESLRYTYGGTIAFSAVAFLASLTIKERKI